MTQPEVLVCDVMMGGGKTSAAIEYMKEVVNHERIVYATPLLDEGDRIVSGSPVSKFITPTDEIHSAKHVHLAYLLSEKKNVAISHKLFDYFTPDIDRRVQEGGYTLLIDEAMNGLVEVRNVHNDYDASDLQEAERIGYLTRREDGTTAWADDKYVGSYYSNLRQACDTGKLDMEDGTYIYEYDPAHFLSFRKIIIMTYMFEFQPMRYYFDMNNINYTYIGVKNDNGKYRFCNSFVNIPSAENLRDRITIEKGKINNIGMEPSALSYSWCEKNRNDEEVMKQLYRNIYNFHRNRCNAGADQMIWTSYKLLKEQLENRHYRDGFVPCTAKATNKYIKYPYAAYCVNRYMNPVLLNYYTSRGCEVNADGYALSEMVQWVWRSAIRDGESSIRLYVPSSRMRRLFTGWLDDLAAAGHGGECCK